MTPYLRECLETLHGHVPFSETLCVCRAHLCCSFPRCLQGAAEHNQENELSSESHRVGTYEVQARQTNGIGGRCGAVGVWLRYEVPCVIFISEVRAPFQVSELCVFVVLAVGSSSRIRNVLGCVSHEMPFPCAAYMKTPQMAIQGLLGLK